jgi:hypothetical protein
LCCAANCFSQAFRSFRSALQRCSSSVMLIMECVRCANVGSMTIWRAELDYAGRVARTRNIRETLAGVVSPTTTFACLWHHSKQHAHVKTATTQHSFEQAQASDILQDTIHNSPLESSKIMPLMLKENPIPRKPGI